MASSLQVAGLASGFDWKGFIDQVMELEHAPADRLANEKSTNTQKVSQLGTLGSKLSALQTAAQALKTDGLFGKRSATSASTDSPWSATAATDTATGSYKIVVSQLATAATLAGSGDIGAALNATDDDVSGLTLATLPIGQAITAGKFTVNGKQVTVATTDSLQDVFDAISSATGGDVTASYDHTTDKITLTSGTGTVMLGASNDTSNILRALKLGNNGTGTVTSSAKLGGVKSSAALASANVSGAITAGAQSFSINGVSISYNAASDSLNTVLKRINDSTAGVSATYDAANDRVVLANTSTGDLGIAIDADTGGLVSALGLASGTTFTRGKNAEFTINGGATLSSQSNTLTSSTHGIAGLSVTVASEGTQTIDVKADTAAMREKVEGFIDKFNDVQSFLESVTKVTTDSKGKVTAAVLSGNREIQDWAHSLRTIAFGSVSGLTGSIKRLADIGIDFKSGTNELAIEDDDAFEEALTNNTTQIESFFSTDSTGFAAKLDTFVEKVTDLNKDQEDRLNKSNDSLDDQIEAIERRLEQQRELMTSAFTAMETAQSKIKQQQSAIDGVWASLKK
jgi:flagellar hook-associated protein 2